MATCSTCKTNPPRDGQRVCRDCHNAYMRTYRQTKREVTEEVRQKLRCRTYSSMLAQRGLLVTKPCEVCGAEKVERHHEDYSNPYHVRWLCPRHHRDVDAGRIKLPATVVAMGVDDLIQMKW